MKRNISQENSTSKSGKTPLAHFYIYENLNYIADSRIVKEQISIGRSRNADVVLDHNAVADIHAFIHFEGQQAFLTNRYPDDGLHLNGQSVHLAKLQHEDVIDIGPYALKVKMDDAVSSGSVKIEKKKFCVALINRYKSDDDMQLAAQRLAKHFRADPVKMALIIAKPEYVIKKDLSLDAAERWQIALQKAGIFCDMRAMTTDQAISVQQTQKPSQSDEPTKTEHRSAETQKISQKTKSIASSKQATVEADISATQAAALQKIKTADHDAPDAAAPKVASQASLPEKDEPADKTADTIVKTQNVEKKQFVASGSVNKPIERYRQLKKKALETDRVRKRKPAKKSDRNDDIVTAYATQETIAKTGADETLIEVLGEDKEFASDTSSDKKVDEWIDASSDVAVPSKSIVPTAEPTAGQKIVWYEDEEDDEEDPWFAPFSLKDKLSQAGKPRPSAMQAQPYMQVVKTIGDKVVDVQFLDKGQKYTIATDEGKLCLASNKTKGGAFVGIANNFSGYINNAKGEATADINSYKRSDYLLKKRQQFYRVPMPQSGEVIVNKGRSQYRIINVRQTQSPEVRVAERPTEFSWRHVGISAATHVVLVLFLSIYWYFQMVPQESKLPHFVKIDPMLLEQLQPKKKLPEPPKVEPPPPKPEPVKVAEKLEPPKKKPKKTPPKPVAKSTKPKRKIKKVAKARQPSRHPKAGGGFGKGNVKNRNINQTGILSVLGKTPLAGPSTAIASVTNLDAVKVPGATEKNFTVGGVKGKLGNGKIAVTSGERLETKSSELVLRSAGAKGPGQVAALEKGNTGKKQIQAMVTAKMSRTVRIQGGMSREMVKQVIDQHLEEITYCYETALMSNPSIMGRIVFEWKILMSGRVGQIRIVASSVNSHEVHNCIKSAIKSWQFPKPQGAEVVVSYPFVFDLVAF